MKVKVRVNTHGIFTISTASMVEKIPAEENEVSSLEADMDCQNQRPPENPDAEKNIQQDNNEAGTQPQVQTDGHQTSQSPLHLNLPQKKTKSQMLTKLMRRKLTNLQKLKTQNKGGEC